MRTAKKWERSKSFQISHLIERNGQALSSLAVSKFQEVARLAGERLADCRKRRKADRARLAGLEDREIGQRHSNLVREFGQCHPPIVEQVVELDGDRHVTRF